MTNDEQAAAAAARAQQDADAELSGYADPAFDDDGRELREPVNAEPEVRNRTYPTGTTRPNRAKSDATSVSFRLPADCVEYLRFLVENGNAGSLTHAVELCIRGDRAAQSRKS